MLQRLLLITLTLCSLTASAQWQQTGSKVRYVNGLGIPTKDTAAGVSADSSQILIRPADSSLYVKYKRTWLRVGGGAGGGSIGGSGTTNYLPKFTSSSNIGNSQLFDNGTSVGIGTTNNGADGGVSPRLAIANPSNVDKFVGIGYDNAGDYGFIHAIHRANAWKNLVIQAFGGNVGIGTAVPSSLLTVNGTTKILAGNSLALNRPDNGAASTISTDANNNLVLTGASRISLSGTTLINTTTDNGVDKLQVSGSGLFSSSGQFGGTLSSQVSNAGGDGGILFVKNTSSATLNSKAVLAFATDAGGTSSNNPRIQAILKNSGNGASDMEFFVHQGAGVISKTLTLESAGAATFSGAVSVSTLATTNNLSVTTNATVGGSATITGNTQINGLIGVNTTPQTYAIKLQSSGNNIIEFGTQSATNYSRFLHSSSQAFGTIGNASGAGISGGSNGDFAIGTPTGSNNIIFHINAVERVRIKTDGEVLVFSSTDNGAYNLQCNGTGVWGAGAYVNGSDSALKYQIKDIDNALHLVMQLKPKTYKYKPFYNNSTETQTGFIAQDLEKVLKNEIYKDGVVISGGKYKGVAYDALIPLLVKTIQEQQSQIEDIKKQIEELKKLIKQ